MHGEKTSVPEEIKGWNWGAFSFNIIWGIANKSYLPLLALIPIFNIIWVFVCGFRGSEWAWKKGGFQNNATDIDRFQLIQKTWKRSGFWFLLINLIGIVLISGTLVITRQHGITPTKVEKVKIDPVLSKNNDSSTYTEVVSILGEPEKTFHPSQHDITSLKNLDTPASYTAIWGNSNNHVIMNFTGFDYTIENSKVTGINAVFRNGKVIQKGDFSN
ncbi:hypothetical protein [Weissella minor]|uniref:Uncharacterized protein n=1 Tax=Weissella minor TaxID=1620 RepID=A0A0R2JII5_9LACO|nr:hypothetical protein IV67_GL000607 [Weissella minor]